MSAQVRDLMTHPEATRFVERASRMDLNQWGGSEDVAIGFLLSRLQSNITYVKINTRKAANLGCYKNKGLYFWPTNASVVVHFVKKPLGMSYLWDVLHGRKPHDPRACKRAAGIG